MSTLELRIVPQVTGYLVRFVVSRDHQGVVYEDHACGSEVEVLKVIGDRLEAA